MSCHAPYLGEMGVSKSLQKTLQVLQSRRLLTKKVAQFAEAGNRTLEEGTAGSGGRRVHCDGTLCEKEEELREGGNLI